MVLWPCNCSGKSPDCGDNSLERVTRAAWPGSSQDLQKYLYTTKADWRLKGDAAKNRSRTLYNLAEAIVKLGEQKWNQRISTGV